MSHRALSPLVALLLSLLAASAAAHHQPPRRHLTLQVDAEGWVAHMAVHLSGWRGQLQQALHQAEHRSQNRKPTPTSSVLRWHAEAWRDVDITWNGQALHPGPPTFPPASETSALVSVAALSASSSKGLQTSDDTLRIGLPSESTTPLDLTVHALPPWRAPKQPIHIHLEPGERYTLKLYPQPIVRDR